MTSEEGFRLITRALVLCCLIWFFGNLLFLPIDITGVVHHEQLLRLPGQTRIFVNEETYLTRYYAGLSFTRLVTMVMDLWLALWLYRRAAGLRKFFGMEAPDSID
jgi:hypothetical protein